MDPTASPDERALRAQLERAREKLDARVRDLRALDRELEELSAEGKPYRLLGEVCARLQELNALGASALFWGEGGGDRERVARLAQGRADAFEKRFAELEERRQAVLEEILQQQEGAELLEEDVLELERQEEERKLEWEIEREIGGVPQSVAVMPWTRAGEDDARFRKSLATALLVSVAFALAVRFVDLPLPEPWHASEAPERWTRLIQPVRPPPRAVQPELAKPKETRVAKLTPRKPQPSQPTMEAPEREAPAGLLAFREKLSRVAALEPDARLGLNARLSSDGDAASGQPVRNMLTTRAPGSSGVNLGAISRGVGGGGTGEGMRGVAVASVKSSIAGQGGGGAGSASVGAGRGNPALGRTDEEIQIVFDRHKAALYRLYNRELRTDPTLQGQIVLRMRIEPDGSVSLCALQSTDMDAPQLAAQVVERVRGFDFGAKQGIAAVTILYPIDFLPAT